MQYKTSLYQNQNNNLLKTGKTLSVTCSAYPGARASAQLYVPARCGVIISKAPHHPPSVKNTQSLLQIDGRNKKS